MKWMLHLQQFIKMYHVLGVYNYSGPRQSEWKVRCRTQVSGDSRLFVPSTIPGFCFLEMYLSID